MTDSEALTEARVRHIAIVPKSATQAEISELAALALSALGTAPAVQCCMCGKTGLSTVEGDGGTECQLEDGRWTCSADCYYRAIGDVEPVAWRCWDDYYSKGQWMFSDVCPGDGWTPLYASPAPANAAEIRAKALREAEAAIDAALSLPQTTSSVDYVEGHRLANRRALTAVRALSEATANDK